MPRWKFIGGVGGAQADKTKSTESDKRYTERYIAPDYKLREGNPWPGLSNVGIKSGRGGTRRRATGPGGASIEHEDGYELTAILVVALLKQYDLVRKPGIHLMGHLADPGCLFQDMERMGAQLRVEIN